MTNEHNPIALLVTKIQRKWAEEITPNPKIKLVRWLIDIKEAKLFEGFLQIESSADKKLPEVFVTLLTPFKSKSTYSKDLINSWFETFDKEKKDFDQLVLNDKLFNWNDNLYKEKFSAPNVNCDELLIKILSTFHQALNVPDRKLTLALFQNSITSTSEYNEWIKTFFKLDIPQHIQFCIFDLKDERFYDDAVSSLNPATTRTLISDLNLAGAIKKVIQSGNPNDPGVRLQQYIQVMSEAVSEKDLRKLDSKGNACIEDMTRSKNKSLMATAYIAYAGMLFNFKKYDAIDTLLNNGLKIAEIGKKAGDLTCKMLIMQFYSFKAANYQLNKKNKEALEWFCKSAEASIEVSQVLPAIASFQQASLLAKKYDTIKYPQILERAYDIGKPLSKDELSFSAYPFISLNYYNFLIQNGEFEKRDEIDNRMKEAFGFDWKEKAQEINKKSVPA